MSKGYTIKGSFTGYEYSMTFYDDTVEISYVGNGRYYTLFTFSPIGNQYELDNIRDSAFVEDMFDQIRECGSLEEARDMATITLEAEGLFDYVFDNWGCPDYEY